MRLSLGDLYDMDPKISRTRWGSSPFGATFKTEDVSEHVMFIRNALGSNNKKPPA